MKKYASRFYTAIAAALAVAFLLPSCSAQMRVQKRHHEDPSVEVQIQGGYYPYERHHRQQRYDRHGKPMPPGQAKKVTGSQSAAPYAPGHNKGKGKH